MLQYYKNTSCWKQARFNVTCYFARLLVADDCLDCYIVHPVFSSFACYKVMPLYIPVYQSSNGEVAEAIAVQRNAFRTFLKMSDSCRLEVLFLRPISDSWLGVEFGFPESFTTLTLLTHLELDIWPTSREVGDHATDSVFECKINLTYNPDSCIGIVRSCTRSMDSVYCRHDTRCSMH